MSNPTSAAPRERAVPSGEILVSRTDLRGRITYANSVFAGVSGYTQDELLGQGHNIVRHPDMPAAVFADVWRTLQDGQMWYGLIKNRCKNGDYYWVDALMVPLSEDGTATGYLSVRRQARRADVEAAKRYYAALRDGATRTVKRRGFRIDRYLSIRSGVFLGIAFVALMMVVGAIVGLSTIARAERELRAMYREKVQAGDALGRIKFLMADNRAQIVLATQHDPENPAASADDQPRARRLETIARNRHEIERLWEVFRARMPASANNLVDAFWAARLRYMEKGLSPAARTLAAGDTTAANDIIKRVDPLYDEANLRAAQLADHMVTEAAAQYAAERALHETVQRFVIVGILGALAVLSASGIFFFRGVVRPVEARIRDLENMAEGRLDAHVDLEGGGETGKLNRAFAATQARLQYLLDNSFRGATQISAECAQLKNLVLRIGDGIEDQHERVFRVLTRINEYSVDISRLSEPAERILEAVESLAAESQDPCDAALPGDVVARARALAGSLRIMSFTSDEMERDIEHVAGFLVDNREAMHAMWNATTHLAQTAAGLEKAAGSFEIG